MMSDIIWSDVDEIAQRSVSALVENAEFNYNRQIFNIGEKIYNDSKVSLVLLAGPSASGKTTSANLLASRIEYDGIKVFRISTDDYYRNREDIPFLPSGVRDYDSPSAIDLERLKKNIKCILEGVSFVPPVFDFKSGTSHDGELIDLTKQDIVIIEGIHALNPLLTEDVSDKLNKIKKISIAPRRSFVMPSGEKIEPNDLRLLRRLIRDYYTRGCTFEQTLKQWKEVRRAEEEYIKPFVKDADFSIDSVYEYELLVYKQCIYNTIKTTDIEELQGIKRALSDVNGMEIESIPKTSLLNEFVHYGDLT